MHKKETLFRDVYELALTSVLTAHSRITALLGKLGGDTSKAAALRSMSLSQNVAACICTHSGSSIRRLEHISHQSISSNTYRSACQGNRIMPQCGYSGTVVNILQSLSVPFETVDVLADDRIRQGVKASDHTYAVSAHH